MSARPPRARLDATAPASGRSSGGTSDSLAQRIVLRLLIGGLAVAQRLPDRPIYRLAFMSGRALSRVLPARRALVRANLARVCEWLVAEGRASPEVASAASDPARLDALTSEAFGHWVVAYAESALAPRYSGDDLRKRIVAHDARALAVALAHPGPGEVGRIQLGMHFGSIELAGLYGTRVIGLPVTAPMEQVAGTLARGWFDHVRKALGITIVPIAGAAQVLAAALRRGEMVGLVADRVIGGSGARVTLFGAPARLPVGPAVLAIQTGAPIHLQVVRRTAPGRWVGHTVPIHRSTGGERRAGVRAILEAQARAFEGLVAEAPQQWSTLFFRIWDDSPGDP